MHGAISREEGCHLDILNVQEILFCPVMTKPDQLLSVNEIFKFAQVIQKNSLSICCIFTEQRMVSF